MPEVETEEEGDIKMAETEKFEEADDVVEIKDCLGTPVKSILESRKKKIVSDKVVAA